MHAPERTQAVLFVHQPACVFHSAGQLVRLKEFTTFTRILHLYELWLCVSRPTQIEGYGWEWTNNRWRNKVVFSFYPCSGEPWVAQIHCLVSLASEREGAGRDVKFWQLSRASDAIFPEACVWIHLVIRLRLLKPCWLLCLPVPPPTSGYVKTKALIDSMVVHSHMREEKMQHRAGARRRRGGRWGNSKKKKKSQKGHQFEVFPSDTLVT